MSMHRNKKTNPHLPRIVYLATLLTVSSFSAQLVLLPNDAGSSGQIEILHSDNKGVIAEISIPTVNIDSLFYNDRYYFDIDIPRPGFSSEALLSGGPASVFTKIALYSPPLGDCELRILELSDTTITGYRIAPPVCDCDDSFGRIMPNPMAYNENRWYFDEVVAIDQAFKWRKIDAVGLRFNLYSYNPSGDSLRIHRRVKFEVSFKSPLETPTLESWLEDIYLSHFLNLESGEYHLSYETESYQALYIFAEHAGGYYETNAQRLADLRYRQGWRVHLASAQDIYQVYAPLYPAESETTWIRRFIADTFETYGDLSYVGLVGPDAHDRDSLPGVKLSDGTHPPVTESTYSLPLWLPRLAVGRVWAVKSYGGLGTEGFVDRIIQNECEFIEGGDWNDFMFVSQTTDIIYGYIDAAAQEPAIRSVGYDLTHYTCHDTFMGMTPAGTLVGLNSEIVSALESDRFGAVWHFGHGGWGAWAKSGGACCGSDEAALSAYHLFFRSIGYPTGVISGGCQTAREFGYEFTGRGALFYYGGITDGGDPHDFVQRIRSYQKLVGNAWQNYLIWSPRLIGDPLTRYYGPIEPTRYIVTTSPECTYFYDGPEGDSLYVQIAADGPARWVHETKICLTARYMDDSEPLCKVVPYAGNCVAFSAAEISEIDGLDLGNDASLFVTCTRRDFITKTIEIPISLFPEEDSAIVYTPEAAWNLISIPLDICHSTLSEILPEAERIMLWDEDSQELVDASARTLDPSSAYWVEYIGSPEAFTLEGPGVNRWERPVREGWNAIGSVSTGELWKPWIEHLFSGTGFEGTRDFVFEYDPRTGFYRPSTGIEQGKGYLYLLQGNGVLVFPESGGSGNPPQRTLSIFELMRLLPNPPGPDGTPISSINRMHAEIDFEGGIIRLSDALDGAILSNATILFQSADSIEFVFEEISAGSGEYAFPFEISGSGFRMLVKRPGYIDFQALGGGSLGTWENLWGDVALFGGLVVAEGESLVIREGTAIRIQNEDADRKTSKSPIAITASGEGAYIGIAGSAERPVFIGCSGEVAERWDGLFANSGGNIEIDWAEIDGAELIELVADSNSTSEVKISNSNFIDCGAIHVEGNGKSASSRLLVDNCVLECPLEVEDLGYESRISNSVFSGPTCAKVLGGSCELSFENSRFQGFDSTACELAPKTLVRFEQCYFTGRGRALNNRGEATIEHCVFISEGGDYIITSSEDSRTIAEFCSFEGYSSACAFTSGTLDFGSCGFGHNCFITDGSEWTFDGESASIHANFCYFDTLKFPEHLKVEAEYRDLVCIPDSGLTMVVCEDGDLCVPGEFYLDLPVPNPFNASVGVEFDIAREAEVSIVVFNMSGRKMAVMVERRLPAGVYRAVWDGRGLSGEYLPSGVYLCRMFVKNNENELSIEGVRKMTLVR